MFSPFRNIYIVEPRSFLALVATYAAFLYLTRQTDRYLREVYLSSRAQPLSTPRSKTQFFLLHRCLLFRPSSQGSARPLSEVETPIGALHTRVIGFSFLFFGFVGYAERKQIFFSKQFRARVTCLDINFERNNLPDSQGTFPPTSPAGPF